MCIRIVCTHVADVLNGDLVSSDQIAKKSAKYTRYKQHALTRKGGFEGRGGRRRHRRKWAISFSRFFRRRPDDFCSWLASWRWDWSRIGLACTHRFFRRSLDGNRSRSASRRWKWSRSGLRGRQRRGILSKVVAIKLTHNVQIATLNFSFECVIVAGTSKT